MFKKIKKWLSLPDEKLHASDILLLFLPLAIWFSYQPLVALGRSDGMNIEISITEIFLLAFALSSIPRIWRRRRIILKSRLVWLPVLFVTWATFSLLWTDNLPRGILTVGIVGLLLINFLGMLVNHNFRKLLPALFKMLIIGAVVSSIFAWYQMVADTFGASQDITWLCSGCVNHMFGFPRATGFAIEPQFLGSLLITPIILISYLVVTRGLAKPWAIVLLFLATTFFMTMSRGAIFALFAGMVLMLMVILIQKRQFVVRSVGVAGIMMASLGLSLVAQGALAVVNPTTNETFGATVARSIHQLSLGAIDLRSADLGNTQTTTEDSVTTNAPQFDGYVAESTNVRLELSELAIGTWSQSVTTVVFGVGVGSSGYAMHAHYPDQVGDTEIVQNEYIELLLETGVIGLVIFLAVSIGFLIATRQHKIAWACLLAFAVQWCFFSGYPNAIHIYLTLACLVVMVAVARQ